MLLVFQKELAMNKRIGKSMFQTKKARTMKKIFLCLATLMMMAAPVMISCSSDLEEVAPVEEAKSNIVTITIAPPVAESETRVNIDGSLKITGWEDGVNADVVTLYKVEDTTTYPPESILHGNGIAFTCVDAATGTFSGDVGSEDINDYNLAVFGGTIEQGIYDGLNSKFIRIAPKMMCSENLKDVVMMAAWKSQDNTYTMKIVNNVLKLKNGMDSDKTVAWSAMTVDGQGPYFFNPIVHWSIAYGKPYNNGWRGLRVGSNAHFTGWGYANPFTIKAGVDSYLNMGPCSQELEEWGLAEMYGDIFLPRKAMTGRKDVTGKLYNAGTILSFGKGSAKRTGDIDVNWVQLWAGGPKFAVYNVGVTDGKEVSAGEQYSFEESDPATTLWGSNWRMPTKEEYLALINSENCTATWTEYYTGECGMLFRGKGNYSNHTLFLRADDYGLGNYWSSTSIENSNGAYYLNFGENLLNVKSQARTINCSVRAVLKE